MQDILAKQNKIEEAAVNCFVDTWKYDKTLYIRKVPLATLKPYFGLLSHTFSSN